ncbi:MAG: stage 0 sporulation family protein [Candidatus Omnitrophica bacterium]|nr:stage 0 sporulation family protein [Candidatus Omnitrophota bacterium]
MEKIAQVRLRDFGPYSLIRIDREGISVGDFLIVEVERGLDYVQVTSILNKSLPSLDSKPIKKIIRKANNEDLKIIKENQQKSKEARTICEEKIKTYKLKMKLVGTEFSYDASKVIFYFTAQGRVDFRNLLKELAKIFKVRIELRQIGVRDEAKLFGGIGPCGRVLCCGGFLKEFKAVSIKMAKEQGLPLNPSKLSGICGRLMCCLSYEYETYKRLSRGLPREGEKMHTEQGKGRVISVNILRRSVSVELEDKRIIEVCYD